MNPLALFLLILGVGFGVGALIVFALTGGGLNVFWLLGVFSVIGSLAIQTLWTTIPHVVSPAFDEAQTLSRLDALDGVGTHNPEAWAAASHLFDQTEASKESA